MNGRVQFLILFFLGLSSPGLTFTTNQSASVVIGQTAPSSNVAGTSAVLMTSPYDVWPAGNGLATSEEANRRYLIFNNIPASNGVTADRVIGQPDFSTATANTGGLSAQSANVPRGVLASGSRLFAGDLANNRVLIFNSFPVTNFAVADVVLGQPDFLSNSANQGLGAPTSQTLYGPHLLYSDGTRLFIADAFNNRVLIYNSIPVTNNSPADIVIGQPDFVSAVPNNDIGGLPSARTLNGPRSVCLVGNKLVIGDRNNNRVLIYNSVPVSNYAPANVVIGQPDMASIGANQGGAPASNNLNNPYGVASDGVTLYMADILNNRVLIFNNLPVTNDAPADEVLGQPDMVSNAANQGGSPAANTLSQPAGLAISGAQLYVADVLNNRVLIYGPTATFTPTATRTPTNSPTPTPSSTLTPSPTLTPTNSPTKTATLSPTTTPSKTPSPTPTSTPTLTPVPTDTPTPNPLGANSPGPGNSFVYPSPATGPAVNVAYNMAGSGRVRILFWNANAELAAEVDDRRGAGAQTSQVDIRNFATGVYFFQAILTYDLGSVEKLKMGKFFIRH